jgi:hypothetical protein
MEHRVAFLCDRTALPPALESHRQEHPLDLVVPYVNAAVTTRALAAALKLADGCRAAVTLIAVHVLPYPATLECQEGIRQRLEGELTAVARATRAAVYVKLVFARDREQAYLALLRRQSLVVIGTKHRWWRTGEERFARRLAARGHSVAVIKVK